MAALTISFRDLLGILARTELVNITHHLLVVASLAFMLHYAPFFNLNKVSEMSDKYSSVEERVSYGIGRQMGEQLANSPFDGMQVDCVMEGITDALNSQASPIAEADMEAAFNEINVRLQAQQEEASKELSAKGEAFLADNAGRDGVTVTDSGLQYEVITEGSGEIPTSASTVRTHYHGSLISGKVFDSSVERGEPAEFPVSGVIAGWTEALQMMPIGSKWRLFVPHQLAYGQQGAGADIGPCEALIFEVELLAIV